MPPFYITSDLVGADTGGGYVTKKEYEAFRLFDPEAVKIDGGVVGVVEDPFENDERFCAYVEERVATHGIPRIAHCYSGCFTTTIQFLKNKGTKIVYYTDAHDPGLSIDEVRRAGKEFPYRHLVDPNLRVMYVKGYLLADVVMVPSTHSRRVMENLGCRNIAVVPHAVKPLPSLEFPGRFTVGYLGRGGMDKGLKYLFEAWKIAALSEASLLFVGPYEAISLWREIGGKNIEIIRRVQREEDYFKRISVHVQPSVTEGFGLPVIEAMACGRPVIVSEGAGAVDAITGARSPSGIQVPARDPKAIADAIRYYAKNPEVAREHGKNARENLEPYSWKVIAEQYLRVWKSL